MSKQLDIRKLEKELGITNIFWNFSNFAGLIAYILYEELEHKEKLTERERRFMAEIDFFMGFFVMD